MMKFVLALFSHALLSTAAWTTPAAMLKAPTSVSFQPYHFRLGGIDRTGRIERALFTTVALTSTASSNKLFARGEDAHLLPRSQKKLQQSHAHSHSHPRQRWRWLLNLSGGASHEGFRWTPAKVLQALAVFCLAGIAEIGGGWLVWKAVREHKPWWWALVGSLVMVIYGFLPTLQPTDSFGRIYAVYGGFFIALSYAWGWYFDGMKPDAGDVLGGSLALLAVLIILFWPRQ